jgi:outer membrane protein TolC
VPFRPLQLEKVSMKLLFTTLFTVSSIAHLNAATPKITATMLQQINELQEKSRELSPELKSVRAFKSQKSAESYTKLTTFLPQANLIVKKEKDFFEERNATLRALGINTSDSTWGIDYSWTLLNYGAIQNARKSFTEQDKAELEVAIKEREYSISFNTNVLTYLLATYKKAAVENSLKKADAGKREAEIGFKIGQKTKLDVLRTQANMVSLESKKTSFVDEEQNTRSTLLETSGLSSEDLAFLDNLSEEETLALISTLSKSVSSKNLPDFNKSPQLKNLAYEEKINTLALSGLTANQYPDLKIVGTYTNSGDTFSQTLHTPYRTHAIALVLTIPIFSGGSFTSSHFERYFAGKQIEYTIGQRKLQLQNQLNNTLTKVNALESLVNSLTINVSQYEELYRLTLKSYQLGRSTLIELLEVQDNLLDSKINLAQQKIQFYTLSQNYLWQAGL